MQGNFCGFPSNPLLSVTFGRSVLLARAVSSATGQSNIPASTGSLFFTWAAPLCGCDRASLCRSMGSWCWEGPTRSRRWRGAIRLGVSYSTFVLAVFSSFLLFKVNSPECAEVISFSCTSHGRGDWNIRDSAITLQLG